MKKIILSAALFFTAGISAQTYFEDNFEGSITNKWTLHDADGDGYNWEAYNYQDGQGQVATSLSWDGSPLTPDNWMISNAIDLSDADGTIVLTWLVKGQDQAYANENYSVYAGTSDDIDEMESIFSEVIGATNDEYVLRVKDLSEYGGQEIHIAFRHHNVSDQFRLNIDDVKVGAIENENDVAINSININNGMPGNKTFTIKVMNNGENNVSSFDLDWSFNGESGTEEVNGIDLSYGESHSVTVNVSDVEVGTYTFTATLANDDDDNSNNTLSENFTIAPEVIQYVATDIEGNKFDLYEALGNGQMIMLDFMASWCQPCQQSTPELSKFIQDNGSGNGIIQALAVDVEPTDNAAIVAGLNWNGGYYEYPKFAYTQENDNQFYHYNTELGLGSDGIPFFVLICPDKDDPANSYVAEAIAGFGPGMFDTYFKPHFGQCEGATASLIDIDEEDINFLVYPNPANTNVTVDFELNQKHEVAITVVDMLGKTVYTNNLGSVVGPQSTTIDVSNLESGIYNIQVQTETGSQTQRISVVK